MSGIKTSSALLAERKVVAAVHSPGALRCALKIRPDEVDFLEIRVDAFAADPAAVLRVLPRLRVPLIVTVRHPAEGGAHRLNYRQRRDLFVRFLPFAAFIDVELRSLESLATTVSEARRTGIKLIASTHFFRRTPSAVELQRSIRRAHAAGADIAKLAALTATPSALSRLLALFCRPQPQPLSLMGMGRFGKISRLLFAQAGSVLNYGYLDEPNASGQWEAVTLKKRILELDCDRARNP